MNLFNRKLQIKNRKSVLFRVFDVDYLPAFIHSGLGVNAVRHHCFARIFIGVELRRFERVVSTTRARACM